LANTIAGFSRGSPPQHNAASHKQVATLVLACAHVIAHPTGYQPDPVKLQGYYSDLTQLVLLNPKFA
jgi:hypothetical protein